MKKIFTKTIYAIVTLFSLVGISAPVFAQAPITTVASGVGASAIAKDNAGNTYVIENPDNFATGESTDGQIVRYTAGSGASKVVYSGAFIANNDFVGGDQYAFGIVVDASKNIYFTTSIGQSFQFGAIIKLTYNAGTDTYSDGGTPYIDYTNQGPTIAYPTGLALDANNHLFVLLYDANDDPSSGGFGATTVSRYVLGTTTGTNRTEIYAGFELKSTYNSADGYSSICALAADPSGNVYAADWFDYSHPANYGGFIEKLTYNIGTDTYTPSQLLNNAYCQALGWDATNNFLYANTSSAANETSAKLVRFAGGAGAPTTIYSGLTGEFDYWNRGMAVDGPDVFTAEGDQGGAQHGYYMHIVAPPTSATNVSFNSTGSVGTTISWTSGSSTNSAVFVAAASSGNPTTVANTTYTASTTFGSGTLAGTGWNCVYNGTGTSVTITGLSPNTTYRAAVVAYSNSSGLLSYDNNTTATNNPNNVTTATPAIAAPGGTTTVPSATSGIPGPSTSFNITGSNLAANITATAPTNFQVSADNSTWGTTATITESGGTLTSTPVYVRLSGTGSVGGQSGNVALSSTGATIVNQAVSGTLNSASTTISSLTAVSSTTTNAASVQYTATFAASVSGLSTADFGLTTTGVTGASVTGVSGSGTSWTVTVNTGSGSGTVQLVMNSSSGVTPSVSNATAGSPFAGATYTIDKTAPTVSIGAPSVSFANTSTTVNYTVTWSDANLNSSSISLSSAQVLSNITTTGTASVGNANISAVSGNSVTVSLSNVAGNGTVAFTVPAGTASDNAGNPAVASNLSTAFTEDNTPPVVTIGAPSTTTTSTGPVTYDVSFSDANFNTTTFNKTNVIVTPTGTAGYTQVTVAQNSPTDFTVSVDGTTGNGTLDISVQAGTSSDLAGNVDAGAGPSASFNVAQPVAINSLSAASSSPTNASSVNYTATFAAAITGLSASNFSITASGPSGASVGTPTSGDGGITWTVPVNTGSGDGTIQLVLANATGIAQGISTSLPFAGGTYTIDKTAPTVAISAPSPTITSAGPVSYTVTFADANFSSSSLTSADIFPNVTKTGTADFSNAVVTGSGTSYTVTFSGVIGDGTLGFTVPAGKATDAAGNQSPASSPSATFIVDNTPPTIAISAPSATSIGNNGTGTVSYTVTYADANFGSSTLGLGNITLNTTGTANGTVGVTGSGTSYTVTISNVSGLGTLGISIGAGTATDQAGNSAPASSASATFNVLASDAVLAKFSISNGILTPGFSPGTFTYTDAIGNLTSGIWVIPITDDPNATVTVDGNPATSGVRTSTIPVSVGANTVTVVVTAQDGVTTQTYTVTVNRPLPNIAALSSLALSPATTLKVTAGPGDYNYTAAVTNGTTSIQVLPTAQDNLAAITVNSSPVASGSLSQSIPLNVGANTITTVVTAEDGVAKKTYIITVNRAADLIATLSNLAVSTGTLGPVFSSSTTSYGDVVPYTTASVKLTPTTTDPNATVTVNGQAVASGALSQSITLNVGSNTVATVVTAQNGVNKVTYNTVVTRTAPATNAALASITATPTTTLVSTTGPGYLNFNANVANGTTSIQVTPTATAPTATITVNGSPVASGTLSQVIPLNIGANTITTVLTAQDGTTTKKVIITVTRAASSNTALANLTVNTGTLAPAFTAATNNYSVSVPNTVNQIGITPTTADATATITVGGAPATSGSQALISLALGLNTIPVTVTAQNGAKHTYNVNVTRVPSADAALASITLAPSATLVGATGAGYYNYTASVGFSTANIQVTPVTTDATATVTVNGSAVASGSLSQSIPLNVGANTITAVVTAQDGTTTRTAIITVTRAGAAVSSLANLAISAGTLSPAFATGTLIYTASVPYPTATVTLTPTTTDPNATVTVNGSPAATPVALSVGTNKIVTVVTAQNGTATSTYTTYVTRAAPSTNALYTSIVLNPASTLVAATGQGDLNYTSAVDNSEASVQVVATAQDATAAITVNGQAVTSGSPSQAIALNVGSNTITTVITAQDGVTTKTAIITVTRAVQSANNVYEPISVTKPADVVTLEDGITVHQAVSPNGDGINDYLAIDGITNYPNNNLMIVDRNGVMVYQAKGYDNSSKLFDGHSNVNGRMQLPGTYFYSLDYTAANGENKHKTGYIILKY